MDLPMWFILVASLLSAGHAKPADTVTQELKESNEPSHPSKVQKREPQVQMKEVVLFITPSQIKAIESGLIQPQELLHTQIHPEQLTTIPNPVTSSATDELNQHVHTILNDAGQTIQKEMNKLEINKQRNVQPGSNDNRAIRIKDQLRYVRPELNLQQSHHHPTREEYNNWPQTVESHSDNRNINFEGHPIPNSEKQVLPDLNKLINAGETEYNVGRGQQHNTLPYFKTHYEPQVQDINVNQEKSQQNYAYLYLYPKGEPVDLNKYHRFYPEQKTFGQQLEENPLELSQHIPQKYLPEDEQQQKQFLSQLANQQQELLLQADNRPKELHFQSDHRTQELQAIQSPKQVHFQVENRPQEINHRQKPKLVNFQLEHRPLLNIVSEQRPEQENIQLQETPQEITAGQGEKQLHMELGDLRPDRKPNKLQFKNRLQEHQNQKPTELFLQTQHKPKDLVLYSNEHLKEILLKQQQPKPLLFQSKHNLFSQAEQLPKDIFPNKEYKSNPIQIDPGHDIKQLLSQPELQSFLKLNPKYELVPYEYALKNKLEAQQILIAKLNENEFNNHRLQIHNFKPSQQSKTETEQFLSQTELKPKYDHQLNFPKIENEDKQEIKPKELKESDIKKFDPLFQKELFEIMEAQKEKAKIQKEEKEAHRLDSELEEEEKKAQKFKEEQYKEQQERNQNPQSEYILPPSSLKILMKLGPKTSRTHSILNPLFQGHNIADSLQEQQANFPHNKVQLETGFRPIKYESEFDLKSYQYALGSEFSQYAPKYYGEEYSSVVRKIEQRNRIALEQALANAAVLGKDISRSDKDLENKAQTFESVKHVEVPMMVRVEHLLR